MTLAKKKEYETVSAIEQSSHELRETFGAFVKQMRLAEEGAECTPHFDHAWSLCFACLMRRVSPIAVGKVMANWPQMYAIIASFGSEHESLFGFSDLVYT